MKKNRLFYLLLLFLPLFLLNGEEKERTPLKIACVGDSITYGFELFHPDRDSYPAQLQKKLSPKATIKNFGVNGASVSPDVSDSYRKTEEYHSIFSWKPDIIILMLGTNDTKPLIWKNNDFFKTEYLSLTDSFNSLDAKIILMIPPPSGVNVFFIRDHILKENIKPIIKEIAKEKNLSLIDFYDSQILSDKDYIDFVHPKASGYAKMLPLIEEELNSLS